MGLCGTISGDGSSGRVVLSIVGLVSYGQEQAHAGSSRNRGVVGGFGGVIVVGVGVLV